MKKINWDDFLDTVVGKLLVIVGIVTVIGLTFYELIT